MESNAGHGSTGIVIRAFDPEYASYDATTQTYKGGISPSDLRTPYVGIPATGSTGCTNAPSAYFSPCPAATNFGSALIPYAMSGTGSPDDLMAFLWETSGDGAMKLFAFSAKDWGNDLASENTLDGSTFPSGAPEFLRTPTKKRGSCPKSGHAPVRIIRGIGSDGRGVEGSRIYAKDAKGAKSAKEI